MSNENLVSAISELTSSESSDAKKVGQILFMMVEHNNRRLNELLNTAHLLSEVVKGLRENMASVDTSYRELCNALNHDMGILKEVSEVLVKKMEDISLKLCEEGKT